MEKNDNREEVPHGRKDWQIRRKYQGVFSAKEAVEKIIDIHIGAWEGGRDNGQDGTFHTA